MAENKALQKPKFIKVKDLEQHRSGYNVYAKVVSADHKLIETKEGLKIPMVDCIVADQTGSSKAFFKGDAANLIQKGNVIAIRNGVKRFIKDHISIQIDVFGRVTLEKDVNITPNETVNISDAEHKLEKRRGGDRRGGDRRGGDRRGGDRRREGDREGGRGEGRRDNRPRGQNRGNRDREGGSRNLNRSQNQQRFDRRREERPRREYDRDFDRKDRNYERRDRQDRGERRERREDRGERGDRGERRDRGEERGNRQYRPRREYTDKRQENRGERRPIRWTKLAETMPGDENLSLNVKVLTLTKVGGRSSKYRCLVGDSSGVSNAFLPAKIELKEGDSIVLFNAKGEVVNEHIEIQLDFNGGRIEYSRRPVDKINEQFNLSSKAWVPIE